EALISDLDTLYGERAAATKRGTIAKSFHDPRIKSIVENPTAPRKNKFADFGALQKAMDADASRVAAASPAGIDRVRREKIERATTMLKSMVAAGSLTAIQASTFEARIHRLSENLTLGERFMAEQGR